MSPGTIFYHKNFKFKNGGTKDKLVIVLAKLDTNEIITVVTTSKNKNKGNLQGCQINDRYPNFYIPKGSSSFRKDTWINLDDFYPFPLQEIFDDKCNGDIEVKSTLDETMFVALLNCSIESQDISDYQEDAIRTCLSSLLRKNPQK